MAQFLARTHIIELLSWSHESLARLTASFFPTLLSSFFHASPASPTLMRLGFKYNFMRRKFSFTLSPFFFSLSQTPLNAPCIVNCSIRFSTSSSSHVFKDSPLISEADLLSHWSKRAYRQVQLVQWQIQRWQSHPCPHVLNSSFFHIPLYI